MAKAQLRYHFHSKMAAMPHYPCFHPFQSIEVVSLTNKNSRNCTFKVLKVSSSSEPEPDDTDPVKLALAKAKAYKKAVRSNPTPKITQTKVSESFEVGNKDDGPVSEVKTSGGNNGEIPLDAKLTMERAKEYRENKGVVGRREKISEVEHAEKRIRKKEKPTISSIDFVGLGFSDKKQSRGLPPGLVPISNSFPEGDLPDVEIIVGDSSKFGDAAAAKQNTTLEEDSELYKPKVSTWGVFPRPGNISKTYGGGKVIRPGEVLESAEAKAAKAARTRKLVAAYKRQIGLNIDPKLKFECEKALKDGDSLMDLGKLKEALSFYEEVMDKLPFQSELHGLAALQWSICQDSLSRSNEARVMYEKLQSHPNVPVSKKARQFMFGFQAMEMMKVTSSTFPSMKTGYQNFFEAFIENKASYPLEEETQVDEDALNQALPYVLFLLSPILLIFFIAVQKGL